MTSPRPRRDADPPVHDDPAVTARIVGRGIAVWFAALVLTLAVPSLHSGDRSWWPWVCAAGIVLGVLGWLFVRRGRGNAAHG